MSLTTCPNKSCHGSPNLFATVSAVAFFHEVAAIVIVSPCNCCVLVSLPPPSPPSSHAICHAVACTGLAGGPRPCPGTCPYTLFCDNTAVRELQTCCPSVRPAPLHSCRCHCLVCAEPTLTTPKTPYINSTHGNDTSGSPLNFATSPPFYPSPYVHLHAAICLSTQRPWPRQVYRGTISGACGEASFLGASSMHATIVTSASTPQPPRQSQPRPPLERRLTVH